LIFVIYNALYLRTNFECYNALYYRMEGVHYVHQKFAFICWMNTQSWYNMYTWLSVYESLWFPSQWCPLSQWDFKRQAKSSEANGWLCSLRNPSYTNVLFSCWVPLPFWLVTHNNYPWLSLINRFVHVLFHKPWTTIDISP
jgi:hypothetical protein